jgi:hypothetical protein
MKAADVMTPCPLSPGRNAARAFGEFSRDRFTRAWCIADPGPNASTSPGEAPDQRRTTRIDLNT